MIFNSLDKICTVNKMPAIPTEFAENLAMLSADNLSRDGQAALQLLQEAGFQVATGLRRADVPQITAIAGQEGVREFCPNDLTKRFGDEEMAERWLKKERLFFQLLGKTGIDGYGWLGPEKCAELPDYDNTFAVRLSESVAGRGLGELFTKVIVSAGVPNIGLETWRRNKAAVRTYEKAGAELVREVASRRPTVQHQPQEDGLIPDVRLFMRFPQTFANQA